MPDDIYKTPYFKGQEWGEMRKNRNARLKEAIKEQEDFVAKKKKREYDGDGIVESKTLEDQFDDLEITSKPLSVGGGIPNSIDVLEFWNDPKNFTAIKKECISYRKFYKDISDEEKAEIVKNLRRK